MGTTITFRRGENDPTSGSGLTLAEPAFNTTLKTFHIGLGYGVTAAWVGAPISGLSAEIAAGITYKTPTLKAVKDYVTDYVTAVNGVLTVNGFAGGVTLNAGTAIGVTASGGNITVTNLGVQSFNGNTGAVQGVSSFNGLTGAVGGVCAAQANTFTALQTFNSGISASGGTFGSDIAVNAVRIGLGSGNIATNVCLGTSALAVNTTGTANVAVGESSLAANTTGFGNVGVGRRSLFVATNGSGNVGLGASSLSGLSNGSNNIAVGRLAASTISAATGGIYIGYLTTATDSATNEIVIGTEASGFGSNTAVIGATAQTAAYIYGLVHAVGGVSAPGGTFSSLTRFTAGISASGLTVGGAEGIEITRRLPVGSLAGDVNFLKGLSAELRVGNISGSEMVFLGATASVNNPNSVLVIDQGAPEGTPTSGNYTASVKFQTKTGLNFGAAILTPVSGYTTDRTINLPNASGTVALTSQLMGAVNGSTAATTAVTSFNGRTGAVTGASLGANTFTELNTFNAGISVSGGATFASTVRIVGTLSGTGATFSGGVSAAAFNGVAMNTGNDTFTNASLGIGAFALASNNGGYNNTAVGSGALSSNTTGTENAAFGESALTNCTTGSSNVAFGAGTLYENTFGSFNLAIGAQALNFMNGGSRNTAIGSQSLQSGSTGSDQIGIGYRAGSLVEGGLRNVAIGNEAMLGTATPVFYDCVSVGYRSLYSMSAAGASFNTAIGTESMRQTTSGSRNTGVGSNSLRSITTANEVIGIGADAGRYRGATGTTTLTTGTGGIYIGVDSRASGLAQTNEIVIGRSAVGLGSNTAVIGATAQTAAYIYGLVHAVGGVSAPGGTFSALTQFTAGISAAGGVTLAGTFSGTTGSFSKLLTLSNGLSAAGGVTFSSAIVLPINTAPALTIGTHSTRNLILSCVDSAGLIEVGGNTTASLTIRQENGGTVLVGGSTNFVSVIDSVNEIKAQTIGVLYLGDVDGANNGNSIVIDDTVGTIVHAAGNHTFYGPASFASGLLSASLGISAAGGVTFGGTVASDTGYRITSNAINAQTGTTYTFLESDNGKVVTFNNGSAVTVTIPTALPVGFNCTAIQLGAGQVGFTAASGLTMQSYGSQYRLIGQHAAASIIEYSANIVNLSGNLVV